LILLLYGTGLRIGEAIRLRHRDVELNDTILTVRETKFYKTRLVPVSSDLGGVLRAYCERKWKGACSSTATPFLATYDGRPVTHLTAELAFKRIRYEAGVKRTDGFYYQPRLHDFRHTFAVRRLVTWIEKERMSSVFFHTWRPIWAREHPRNVALSGDDQGPPRRSEPSFRTLRVARRQPMKNDSLLGPWIRRFLLEYLVAERNLSRNTQRSYRDTLCLLLPRLALQSRTSVDVLDVEDLSADAVRNFLASIEEERGCSVRYGSPMTRFGIHTLVERHSRRVAEKVPSLIKKRVSPHTIRHTTATHLLRAGVDINTIRAWLGHVSVDTTNVYAEVDLEMKAKALAACDTGGKRIEKRMWRTNPRVMEFLRRSLNRKLCGAWPRVRARLYARPGASAT
jgi:site-specific recombinase XerD